MPHGDDVDCRIIVKDAIDDPVVATADTKQVVRSVKFTCSGRTRIDCESFDSSENTPSDLQWHPLKFAPCGPR